MRAAGLFPVARGSNTRGGKPKHTNRFSITTRQCRKPKQGRFSTIMKRKTLTKNLGNGYFEQKTDRVPVYKTETYTENVQKPVYRQEPVYATKYYYEIDRWTVVDTAKSSGNDQNPSWPEPKLKDGQRTGDKNEHYFVTATYQKKKDKTETEKYEMAFSEWNELKKGEEIELKINMGGFAEINKK